MHGKACGRFWLCRFHLRCHPSVEPLVLFMRSPSGKTDRLRPREAVVAWHTCRAMAYLLQGPLTTENKPSTHRTHRTHRTQCTFSQVPREDCYAFYAFHAWWFHFPQSGPLRKLCIEWSSPRMASLLAYLLQGPWTTGYKQDMLLK